MSSSALQRIEAVFEVLVAGFAGWVITVLAVSLTGLQDTGLLSRPAYISAVLVVEATITLFLIRFLERSPYPSNRSVFGFIHWSPVGLLQGAAAVPVLFLIVFSSGWMFELTFPQYVTEGNPILEMIKTPLDLVAFSVAGIYAGGIKEEVQRAFILIRFEKHLGGVSAGLILWSLVFGLGHFEQGWNSAFSAGVLGLVFGGIFLWKRNLFTAICVHAVYDVTVLLVYWNYFRN